MNGSDAAADLERLLDDLLDHGVLVEREDGALATTEAFDSTRNVYADSYGDASDAVFRSTIAELFDLSESEAERRIETEGVSREMLVAHLAVASHVDADYATEELARMAMLVVDVSPASPIPPEIDELDDDSYEAFLAANERAIVTVWKRHCAPCRAMKEDLDELLAVLPDATAVGGVDGESVPEFRRTYEVAAAPSILLFRDGELREAYRGRVPTEALAEAAERVYGSTSPSS